MLTQHTQLYLRDVTLNKKFISPTCQQETTTKCCSGILHGFYSFLLGSLLAALTMLTTTSR